MSEPLMVEAYHPGTGNKATMPASAMPALRVSGWLLASEHADNQAQAADSAAKTASESKGK